MVPWLSSDALALLGRGLALTIGLTALTSILSLLVGILVGLLHLSGWKIAGIYIEIFRNIPALVLIIFLAFAVPSVFPQEFRQQFFFENAVIRWAQVLSGLSLPYYAFAVTIGLTLNTGAYLAELFRAGVRTIPQEFIDSARTLGASRADAFRQIIFPRGFAAAFPAISTRLIHNMKNTALASFVAVPEFFQATQTSISRTFRAEEFLVLAAVIYLLLAYLFTGLLRWLDSHLQKRSRPVYE